MVRKPAAKNVTARKVKESPIVGQMNLDNNPLQGLSLTDKVSERTHTLFVGVNPGIRSAKIGHYYGGHSNYFWKLLYASRIWPVPLTTEDDDKIVEQGFGLTDVAKRPTPGIAGLSKADFAASKDRLRNLVRKIKPKTVVLVSKTAARSYQGVPANTPVIYGLQTWEIEGVPVFIVPSTSGASLADTNFEEKLGHFKALRNHISAYYSFTRKS